MFAIVHSIYSQSVHALALKAGSMDNDAGRYCIYRIMYYDPQNLMQVKVSTHYHERK